MKKGLSFAISLMLAAILAALPLFAYAEEQKEAPAVNAPDVNAASAVGNYAYNEFRVHNNTLVGGSFYWLTYEEALSYFPSLPLPETFKGCQMEGCQIILYDVAAAKNSVRGEIYTIEILLQNIMSVKGVYSDGKCVYSMEFYPMLTSGDNFTLKEVSDHGFLMICDQPKQVMGVLFARGGYTMRVEVRRTVEKSLFEIQIGLYFHNGFESLVTEENAADYLSDPDLMGLFDSLIAFTKE